MSVCFTIAKKLRSRRLALGRHLCDANIMQAYCVIPQESLWNITMKGMPVYSTTEMQLRFPQSVNSLELMRSEHDKAESSNPTGIAVICSFEGGISLFCN